MAGPTEIGKETLAVDCVKNFLNPSSETSVVLRRFVEIDLLECRRFRFDQNVVTDQCLCIRRTETELIHGVRVDQPVQLIFALPIRIAFRRCLQFGNDQIAFVVRFDQIDNADRMGT